MRQLRPSELEMILIELKRQIIVKEYSEQRNKWAFLAAVITNGFASIAGMFSRRKPKLVDADTFLSREYKKAIEQAISGQKQETKLDKLIQEAKQKGLKVPE